MYAKNNEKRHDPYPICRRSVENSLPRTLKTTPQYVLATPPRNPLDTMLLTVAFLQYAEELTYMFFPIVVTKIEDIKNNKHFKKAEVIHGLNNSFSDKMLRIY